MKVCQYKCVHVSGVFPGPSAEMEVIFAHLLNEIVDILV